MRQHQRVAAGLRRRIHPGLNLTQIFNGGALIGAPEAAASVCSDSVVLSAAYPSEPMGSVAIAIESQAPTSPAGGPGLTPMAVTASAAAVESAGETTAEELSAATALSLPDPAIEAGVQSGAGTAEQATSQTISAQVSETDTEASLSLIHI